MTIVSAKPSGGPSAEVTAAVRAASSSSGVDFAYLMAKAATESNFDADAKASTSSATGLYQFIDSTWLAMVRDHGTEHGLEKYADALQDGDVSKSMRREILALRCNAGLSAAMAAEYTRDNLDHLKESVGGEITNTDLYLAHFLGGNGAEKFIRAYRENPDQPAANLFPGAARANKSIFYKDGHPTSLGQVYARFEAKIDKECAAYGDPASMIAGGVGSIGTATVEPAATYLARNAGFLPYSLPGASVGSSRLSYSMVTALASLSVPGQTRSENGALPWFITPRNS